MLLLFLELAMKRRLSSQAFSLLELLTVVAVILVLAGMLMPVIGRVKAKGRDLSCLNNLRQWGLATHLYAADNNDLLPSDGVPNPLPTSTNSGWYVDLPPLIGLQKYHELPWHTNPAADPGRSIWICPANPRRSNGRNLFHYCLNQNVNGTGANNQPTKMTALRDTGTLVWLFDSKNLPAVGSWNFVHTNIHGGGAQFLYLDGHVRRWNNQEYWLLPESKARTNNPAIRWMPGNP